DGGDLEQALERTLDALAGCAADSRCKWIFATTHTEVASPMELTGMHEGRLARVSIDRSFVDADGTRWVIAFNFRLTEPDVGEREVARVIECRRAELDRAIAFARQLGDQPVRGALYFPLLRLFHEFER